MQTRSYMKRMLALLMVAGATQTVVLADEGEGSGAPVEKQLYATDFTDWPTINRKTATNEQVEVTTKYSKESLTFTLTGVGADPAGNQSKFAAYTGYMVSAIALFRKNPNPTDEEIKLALAGNLCRCTGYEGQMRGFIKYRDARAKQ